MRYKKIIFLKDVLGFMLTSFGGPQAHLAILLNDFVKKRPYITEQQLMELYALSQILPGPTSTQTLIGIAYKVGGVSLAIITFLIWVLPSAAVMCFLAISYNTYKLKNNVADILIFIQPIAMGIVAYAAYNFGKKILTTQLTWILATCAISASLILKNAYSFPILILLGGIASSAIETHPDEDALRIKLFAKVNLKKVAYFVAILILFGGVGAIVNRTSFYSLPIRLFENFYRNGILIFGGGQVLVPLMFTEFVEMKHYLTDTEFLSGFAMQQIIPGPTFSFASYLGAMALANNGYTLSGQIMGSIIAVLGINLPGFILILFIVPFWDDLKKITRIQKSLIGINAVAVGFMISAFILLLHPMPLNFNNLALIIITFLILNFTKIKTPYIIFSGILLGVFIR